jgi:c-di-GMP-binding flagellar brake protein YcgR
VITDLDTLWIADGMRPLGDRRRRIRLEVLGSLWGALEVERRATLMNISRGGALIMSPVPAAVDSTQSVKVSVEGHEVKLTARVRHLERLPDDEGEPRYRMGLEFLEAPAVLLHALE